LLKEPRRRSRQLARKGSSQHSRFPAFRPVKVNRTKAAVNRTKAAVNQTKAAVNQTKAAVNQTKAAVNQTKAAVKICPLVRRANFQPPLSVA